MPRILAIDYGRKRTGLAVTDPLKIIATGLDGIETRLLMDYLKAYFQREEVEQVIIGLPFNLNGLETHGTQPVIDFIGRFKKAFPTIPISTVDEQYTSKMAREAIYQSGVRKKERRSKKLVDEVSATILLQEFIIK